MRGIVGPHSPRTEASDSVSVHSIRMAGPSRLELAAASLGGRHLSVRSNNPGIMHYGVRRTHPPRVLGTEDLQCIFGKWPGAVGSRNDRARGSGRHPNTVQVPGGLICGVHWHPLTLSEPFGPIGFLAGRLSSCPAFLKAGALPADQQAVPSPSVSACRERATG